MEKNGIESRTLVAGNLSRHPFYEHYCEKPRVSLASSDSIHYGGIYLPNNQSMNKTEIDFICKKVKLFFEMHDG